MKRYRVPILILLFSSCILSTFSQPVVDQFSGWIPGDSMYFEDVDTNNIWEGDEGEDALWFFNGLNKQGPNQYNGIALDPAVPPQKKYFPGATYARELGLNIHTWYQVDSSGLGYLGYSWDTTKLVLDDPLTLFSYPLEYGYTHKDNALTTYWRNGKERVYFATSYTHADAYGNLYLPDQLTLNNCLRVKVTLEEIDYDVNGGDTTKTYTTSWYWFAPSVRGWVNYISHRKSVTNGNTNWTNSAYYRTGLKGPYLYMDNISGCAGSATEFYVNGEFLDSIVWDFGDGALNDTSTKLRPLHAYQNPGTYPVTVTGYTGSLSTKLVTNIDIFNPPNVYFPDSVLLCVDDYTLNASTDSATYLWQDGSTDSLFLVEDSGLYWVKVNDGRCVFTDSTYMRDCGSQVFIPTLFSPNGDGMNDVLRILGEHIADLNWVIYNRWGQLVFSTEDIETATSTGWDGTINGKEAPPGTYTWYIRGNFDNTRKILVDDKQSGSVILMR